MAEPIIRVEGLSKQYQIGARQEQYGSLRESLVNTFAAPFKRLAGQAAPEYETIWALKDVSFEIQQGEVVGIIGRNGAGKSTLLKILSRITKPTSGRAVLHGRVASLLEVGTGFHPELTGRENIYLNGAILGMHRHEIERKFDEIVDFAEIEKFLDTPVKRYSSGMYVRLAFAVAAHLEPEILLVDEVLAVGDAAFQKKCLGKMGEVAKGGRTVLFVSHNMAAVEGLCSRGFLFAEGNLVCVGEIVKVIERYLHGDNFTSNESAPGKYLLTSRENKYTKGLLLAKQVRLLGEDGGVRNTFQMGEPLIIEVDVEGLQDFQDAWIGIIFRSSFGQILASTSTGMTRTTWGNSIGKSSKETCHTAMFSIPSIPFTPGVYTISISITRSIFGRIDYIENAASMTIIAADVYGTGYQVGTEYGLIYLNGDWLVKSVQNLST